MIRNRIRFDYNNETQAANGIHPVSLGSFVSILNEVYSQF